jgi:C4-dicarboxylate-specific signal transduction histidine kinase
MTSINRKRAVTRARSSEKELQEALRKAQVELARLARVTTLGELAASIAHEVQSAAGRHCDQRRRQPALARPEGARHRRSSPHH